MRRFPKWLLWSGVAVVATVIAALAVALYAVLRPQPPAPTTTASTTTTIVETTATPTDTKVYVAGDLEGDGSLENPLRVVAVRSSSLDMGQHRVANVGTPVQTTDATNKGYVDLFVQGIIWRTPVSVNTTADLSATYDNGTNGVGATLTGSTALGTINGFSTWVEGSTRILVMHQTNSEENGIYQVTSASDPFVLTRAEDADGSPNWEVQNSIAVLVLQGNESGQRYAITTPSNLLAEVPYIQLGIEPMVWVQVGTETTALMLATRAIVSADSFRTVQTDYYVIQWDGALLSQSFGITTANWENNNEEFHFPRSGIWYIMGTTRGGTDNQEIYLQANDPNFSGSTTPIAPSGSPRLLTATSNIYNGNVSYVGYFTKDEFVSLFILGSSITTPSRKPGLTYERTTLTVALLMPLD